MNGMILYPTDDEIEVLNRAMLIENAPEFTAEEFKELKEIIPIMFAHFIIQSLLAYFCETKPLKINETVLG